MIFWSAFSFSQTDFEKGEKLFASKQYAAARPLFEADLRRNPAREKSAEYLGDIASHEQQWEAAVKTYQKLRTMRPSNATYQYKYGGALAMVAQKTNKFHALTLIADIESAFKNAIANDPKHLEARWALVELYLQLPAIAGGSEQQATRYANELMRLSTVDGYLAHGRIAEYFERYTIAEQQYRKALAVGQSEICHKKLADLYTHKMNQPEKARAVWAQYNKSKG